MECLTAISIFYSHSESADVTRDDHLPGEQAPLEPRLHFLPSITIPVKYAIYTLAVL